LLLLLLAASAVAYRQQIYRLAGDAYAFVVSLWMPPQRPEPQPTFCARCGNNHLVQCDSCGGRGSIDVTIKKPCKQCNGTGLYKNKLSKGSSPCPWCRASGSLVESAQAPCEACSGRGLVDCPDCKKSPP